MLKNKKLLIDKNCPMCSLYGYCFTKLGWIEHGTLAPYQSIEAQHADNIDMERAKSEIAFYDIKTTKTIYGLDAMIEIVGHRFSPLKTFSKSSIIHPLLLSLYRFISYNRKVIYPSLSESGERTCEPALNKKYRWMYIILSVAFTGMILNVFSLVLFKGLRFSPAVPWEYLIAALQIPWQLLAVYYFNPSKSLDYLGNMSTVSIIGALLLIPVLLINQFLVLSPLILVACFMVIVFGMFFEHLRRCKIMGLPLAMTISWMVYGLAILMLFSLAFVN